MSYLKNRNSHNLPSLAILIFGKLLFLLRTSYFPKIILEVKLILQKLRFEVK